MKKLIIVFGIMVFGHAFASAQEMNDSVELKEVVVTSQKPLVKQKDDRILYDMQSDEEAKTNTTMDMLKKVPYVTIDGDGNIKIKGSGNIKVYKDGRPNNSFTKNAKQVLQGIPAHLIERVEVITEPGAKYDAEGVDGILNIVFKKDVTMNGLMGNVSAFLERGNPVGNLWLGTKLGKLDLSANYAYLDYLKSRNETDIESIEDIKADGHQEASKQTQTNNGPIHIIGLEGSLDIDSLNLISMSLNGFLYKMYIYGDATLNVLDAQRNILWGVSDNYDNSNQSYYNFDGKLDWQHLTHRRGEILTASYLLSTSNTHQQFGEAYYDWINRPEYYDFNRNYRDNDGRFVEHTLQIDWERPITTAHKLNLGAKYINRSNTSESYQQHDEAVVSRNDFSHITNVAAAYAEYRYVSPKWSASAGLRYEYSHLKAEFRDGSADDFSKNLSDLVPFAGVTYRINDANTLKLNYSSRVERPGIDYLNPFRAEQLTDISEGNPYLKSSRPNKIALSHSFLSPKLMTSFTLSGSFNNDGIGSICRYIDEKQYSTYGNVMKMQDYSANLYLRWQPSAKTNLTLNLDGGWAKTDNSDMNLNQSRWHFGGNIYLTQEIWWKLKLNANCGRWDGKVENVYNYTSPVYWHGISLQRSFLKEDRLTVRIGCTNPFAKKRTYKQHTIQGDYTGEFNSTLTQRWISGGISYRFGSLKSQVKKAQKTIQNDDLVGQKKGNS